MKIHMEEKLQCYSEQTKLKIEQYQAIRGDMKIMSA